VHNPHKLASDVLQKYFRHSKFASFQRQLNYFGFRKLAGKGKMAPCSYVNEATTMDYRSILAIKRKTTATLPKEKGPKKRERSESGSEPSPVNTSTPAVNPVLVGILQRTSTSVISFEPKRGTMEPPAATAIKVAVGKGVKHQLNGFLRNPVVNTSQMALAQSAVGKGVRHSFVSAQQQSVKEVVSVSLDTAALEDAFTFKDPHQLGMDVQNSLNELSNNFQNSLKQTQQFNDVGYISMLKRDDSLVDLAMIPSIEPTSVSEMQQADADQAAVEASEDTSFLDFSQDDMETI
jgi:HSF-type DNA-binding